MINIEPESNAAIWIEFTVSDAQKYILLYLY